MGKDTTIAWTNHTFNGWIGCTEVSPGCDRCYARVQDARWGHSSWGKGAPRRLTSDANWRKLAAWNREAAAEGRQDLVFCFSMGDVMDDEVPQEWRERLYAEINACPNLTFQLLTKRPHRFESYLPATCFRHQNVILMTTAENQQFYDVRWPILQRAADKYGLLTAVSYEPALGPVSMTPMYLRHGAPTQIIFGGETGPGRRGCDERWAEALLREARQYGVKFFMKQMSAATPTRAHDLIPAHLLIRENANG